MRKFKAMIAAVAAACVLSGCVPTIEEFDFDLNNSNRTDYTRESAGIRLEDDYYGYVNFDFLWNSKLPANLPSLSSFSAVMDHVDGLLDADIKALAESSEILVFGSSEQKISDLYNMCLDTAARDSIGIEPLMRGINAVDNADSINAFIKACGMLYTEYGCGAVFAPAVSEDFYDNTKYSVYFQQMNLLYSPEELLEIDGSAEDMQRSIGKLLGALGRENSAQNAYDIVTMLLDIAENTSQTKSIDISEIYNAYSQKELEQLFTNINVSDMLAGYGLGGVQTVVVFDVGQYEKINEYLTDEYLPLWKEFAVCSLVYGYNGYLPSEIDSIINPSYAMVAEKKALAAVKTELEGEVGDLYAKKHFDSAELEAVDSLVNEIRAAYRKVLSESQRLDNIEREKLLLKLDNMTFYVGFPEEYHCGSTVLGGLLDSVISIRSAQTKENLALYGSEVKQGEWVMSPQTVNAMYSPEHNSITIPAAIINKPFFDRNAPRAANLGALGMVVVHEMTHAFDKDGIKYNEHGCYAPEWIGGVGVKRNEELTKAAEEYFGSLAILEIFNIDGELTAGENIADLGGMQVIASMASSPEELRGIFESYANIWAELSYDTYAVENLFYDVHSPAEIRANAVLSSLDRFYEAYEIAEDDGMYVAPEKRVRVW
ncbi:MAG: M13 family metallopeptidase [Oscillospiraceae bacterium]|nr:M13 family metallopeptidase [Oscillospiraceae bacterium]